MKLAIATSLAFVLSASAHVYAQPPQAPQKAPVQPSPPTAGEMMPPADVTRWLAFFDRLVSTVVSNEANCDKMANDVSHVIDQNRPALELARNARDAHKRLPLAAQQRMLDGVKKMTPGIEKCGDRDNVKAAFAKLDVSRR